MIWNSVALMTTIDVIIVLLAFGSAVIVARRWQLLSRLGALPPTAIIVGAFVLLASMYFYDFATMHIFPAILGMKQSMMLMKDLHLSFLWIGVFIFSALMFIGIVLLIGRFAQIYTQLTDHKDHLEELINEGKRAEEDIATKKAQLSIALDNMPSGMRLIDKDRNYVLFNSQYLKLYDFPEGLLKVGESMLVENLYQAQRGDLGPGDPEELTDKWFAEWKRPAGIKSWERRTVGGKILKVDTSTTPDGGIVNVVTDITERNHAEQAVRDSESRLRSILDNIVDGIVIIDDHGTVEFFGPSAEHIFGYRAEDVVGRNVNMLMPEPYHGEHDTYIANYLETGEAKIIGIGREVIGRRKDGSFFPMELGISKVNQEGRLLFTGILRDITERKRIEKELRQAHNNLETRVEERTRELTNEITERKHAEAQVIQAAKLATLGEMATSVAHELNQPLNVIRMAAGNVLRKLKKGTADPAYLNEKLDRIVSQTERAAAIIDHMRMFGRKAEEKPHAVGPCEAVNGALDLMGEQLRLAEIVVVTELSGTCRPVLGHPVQMEQVILNLLTNARDAIQGNPVDGGGKITLAVNDGGAEMVRITVSDTGGGIPEEAMGQIFEPFFTTKEMGQGTGLGLSVSYGIIRDMGGTIEAENADGGAKFTITLPVAGTDAEKERSDAT